MPIEIGAEGASFNLLIPAIDENADIQTAFRLYHYGEESAGLGTLEPESLAGYLNGLTTGKLSKTPTIIPINANLNDYTESGYYAQNTNAKAQTGTNYPLVPPNIGFAYAGLLRVFNDGANIYQEYQVAGIPSNPVYWRAFFGNLGWTPWQGYAIEGHIHDDRYYTKTQGDNRYFPAIKFKTIRQPNILSNSYTITKNDEDTVLLMNNLSLPHTLSIPLDVSDPNLNISVGTTITIIQANTGQTTVSSVTDVSLNSASVKSLAILMPVASSFVSASKVLTSINSKGCLVLK
jgi:hypothetical protein